MFASFVNRQFFVLMWLLSASVLVGCKPSAQDVSIHAVNYSGDGFSYYVVDPTKPDSSGGGELIDPFAAGGTTCCFSLPKKWRPGIKVQIHTTHWLPERPDGSLPEVKEVYLLDVPAYVDGTPGELWVVRGADGLMSVISSDLQPDHPKWPGKLKGWPIPSLEYRRERWELLKKHEEGGVRLFLSLLAKLQQAPKSEAEEAWEYARKTDPSSIKNFTGADDPRYVIALKKEYTEGLEESQRRLKSVTEARP